VGWVRSPERNPALRRNRAVDFAAGEWLAFLDDDARAAPDWLARAAETAKTSRLFGGRDLLPPGAPLSQRISGMLLATPWIGSQIAAHEIAPKSGPVRRPSDLALCNLFVSRALFDSLGSFDESLGYIGEDTDLVARAMVAGEAPALDASIVVFHDRRGFPGPFLRQRWRYRWKTGRLFVTKPAGQPKALIAAFLGSGVAATVLTALFGLRFFAGAAVVYAAATWALSRDIWRRDPVLFPVAPLAFALHHLNYWLATVCGMFAGVAASIDRRRAPSPPPVARATR
jgi:GT2 family glycosyltransferase